MNKSTKHEIIKIVCVGAIGALLASSGLFVGESWQALAIIIFAAIASL